MTSSGLTHSHLRLNRFHVPGNLGLPVTDHLLQLVFNGLGKLIGRVMLFDKPACIPVHPVSPFRIARAISGLTNR